MPGINTSAALTHFKQHDPFMAKMLKRSLDAPDPISIPIPKPPTAYFDSIVSSIVSQQISTKAADAVHQRVLDLVGGQVTPETILAQDFDTLKACGLSTQKTKYIMHNASIWSEVPIDQFSDLDDEAVIAELTKLYGIGRWTAEMFLMFSMARPDVFSYGDLGLMQGLYQTYDYKPHFVRKIKNTIETWSPHRTLASLTLWHHKDNRPL